MILANLYFTW